MSIVAVTGSFDDLRSKHIRFFDEAGRIGDVHVLLWSDRLAAAIDGKTPKFPVAEREYFVQAIRYVSGVTVIDEMDRDALPKISGFNPSQWAVTSAQDSPARRASSESAGIGYRVIGDEQLKGFPIVESASRPTPGKKKVIVTGCYDWFHTGHVRFFEEVSEYGDLYVSIGHDRNIEMLKGKGHPLFPQDERRYIAQAVRYVKQCLISSGDGWLDAEPEMRWLKPDIYAVNEDGDKPEKREYCEKNGIQYLILKRLPRPGLPKRQSTDLRGF